MLKSSVSTWRMLYLALKGPTVQVSWHASAAALQCPLLYCSIQWLSVHVHICASVFICVLHACEFCSIGTAQLQTASLGEAEAGLACRMFKQALRLGMLTGSSRL